jgi:hypothetical protein
MKNGQKLIDKQEKLSGFRENRAVFGFFPSTFEN